MHHRTASTHSTPEPHHHLVQSRPQHAATTRSHRQLPRPHRIRSRRPVKRLRQHPIHRNAVGPRHIERPAETRRPVAAHLIPFNTVRSIPSYRHRIHLRNLRQHIRPPHIHITFDLLNPPVRSRRIPVRRRNPSRHQSVHQRINRRTVEPTIHRLQHRRIILRQQRRMIEHPPQPHDPGVPRLHHLIIAEQRPRQRIPRPVPDVEHIVQIMRHKPEPRIRHAAIQRKIIRTPAL